MSQGMRTLEQLLANLTAAYERALAESDPVAFVRDLLGPRVNDPRYAAVLREAERRSGKIGERSRAIDALLAKYQR